jgi:hypothetical protein
MDAQELRTFPGNRAGAACYARAGRSIRMHQPRHGLHQPIHLPPRRPTHRHHLARAGRTDTLFSDDATALIHQTSRGYPRAANQPGLAATASTDQRERPHPLQRSPICTSSARDQRNSSAHQADCYAPRLANAAGSSWPRRAAGPRPCAGRCAASATPLRATPHRETHAGHRARRPGRPKNPPRRCRPRPAPAAAPRHTARPPRQATCNGGRQRHPSPRKRTPTDASSLPRRSA